MVQRQKRKLRTKGLLAWQKLQVPCVRYELS